MSRERDRSPRDDRDADVSYDPAPKIFVGGLPFSMTPEDIRETFEELGPVVEFHLPRTQYDPRKHKGFAFITFDSFKTMDTVIHKMHGKEVGGQVITVNRATVNKSRVPGGGGGGGGGGGYGGREYGRYDDRSGGSKYDGRTPYDTSRPAKPIRIGFRCRVTGLAPDVDWRLLKDFLRQIGDVTYANVDEQGRGIGEYMTLDEVREAIDKLTGAAINGSVVKVTPLNFDMQTGQKFDLAEERPNSRYDVSRGGGHSSSDRYNSSHSDRYNGSHSADRYYDSSSRGGGGDRDRDTRGGYGGSSGRYYGIGAEGGSSRGGGGGDTRGGYDSSYRGGYDNSRGGDDRSGRSGGYYQHDSRGGVDRGGYGDRGGGYDTGRGGGGGSYRSGSTRERERSPVGRSGGYGGGGSYRDNGTAGTYGSGRTYDKGGGGGGGYDRTGGYDSGGRYTGGSSGAAAVAAGGSPVTATPATAGSGRYGGSSAAAAGAGGGGGGGAAAAEGAAAGGGGGGQGHDENGAGGGEAAGSYGRTWRVT